MSENALNFKPYNSSFYEKLSESYVLAFKKNFLKKNIYESRFKFKNKYSSIVLLNKNEDKILGHIGFRIHLANPSICNFIAFRFSTFIDSSLKGKGIYQEMMKYASDFLKNEFKVDLIYSWPNKINLISCLKDPKYINLSPINTWQKEIFCIDVPKKTEPIQLSDLNIIKNNLTKDNLENFKKFFLERENKKYFFFKYPLTGEILILGKSEINNNNFFSVISSDYYSIQWILDIVKSLGEKSKKNYVQLWCNYNDNENLRFVLKNGFEPNGPVFNRGIYILNQTNNFNIDLFPSMYHHDAF